MFLLERGIRMTFRKMTALLASVALILGLSGTALAEGSTVPGAVYTEGKGEHKDQEGKGKHKDHKQVREDLDKAGVKDVEVNNYHAGSIAVMVQAGILLTDASGLIIPTATVSSQEGPALFAKALGLASKTDSTAVAAQKATAAGLAPTDPRPNHAMTRMEVARLIATALGTVPKGGPAPFSDLNGLNSDDVLTLTALKQAYIFVGFPDGSFQPDSLLTVGQIAVLLDRVLTFK
jgi:hypothetical protein